MWAASIFFLYHRKFLRISYDTKTLRRDARANAEETKYGRERKRRMEWIERINGLINGWVWGPPMLVLMGVVGVLMTLRTGVFQISHFGHWMKKTIGSIFKTRRSRPIRKTNPSPSFSPCARHWRLPWEREILWAWRERLPPEVPGPCSGCGLWPSLE